MAFFRRAASPRLPGKLFSRPSRRLSGHSSPCEAVEREKKPEFLEKMLDNLSNSRYNKKRCKIQQQLLAFAENNDGEGHMSIRRCKSHGKGYW